VGESAKKFAKIEGKFKALDQRVKVATSKMDHKDRRRGHKSILVKFQKKLRGKHKNKIPDLGRSTRERGNARIASWRVSPSRSTLACRTLLVVIDIFCRLFEAAIKR